MSTKNKRKKNRKLTRELLGLIVADGMISVLCYFLLRSTGGTLAYEYCEKQQIAMDELQSVMLDSWIFNLSILGAMVIFVVLFLVFVGKKLAYIRELTDRIDALRTHRMNCDIPLKGSNELTELAESVNYLAETERKLKEAESQMQAERTALIRGLSHDIRTPLTAILSYTEYLQNHLDLSAEQAGEFLELMRNKAEQIKALTDQLLDSGARQMTDIEDGRLLMEQLSEEWMEMLEDDFQCETDLSDCPAFGGEVDVQALRRIFDNLASNIEKYADVNFPIFLAITRENERIAIKQSNKKRNVSEAVESRKIGLESIRRIAESYGGNVNVRQDESAFEIHIVLFTTP